MNKKVQNLTENNYKLSNDLSEKTVELNKISVLYEKTLAKYAISSSEL
jgi:hypothetical protein